MCYSASVCTYSISSSLYLLLPDVPTTQSTNTSEVHHHEVQRNLRGLNEFVLYSSSALNIFLILVTLGQSGISFVPWQTLCSTAL